MRGELLRRQRRRLRPRSGRMIEEVVADEELGPLFCRADTIIAPRSTPTPRRRSPWSLREASPARVEFGPSDLEPEVTMTMDADVGAPVLARRGQRRGRPDAGPDQGVRPGRQDPPAGAADRAALSPVYRSLLAAERRGPGLPAGPSRHERGRGARGLGRRGPGAGQRIAGSRYEAIGGLNPRDAPAALCPGGSNRLTGELVDGFWGASCDAPRARGGELFCARRCCRRRSWSRRTCPT